MHEQPHGPLERSLERWANLSPEVVADGSRAQMVFALRAAQKDIATLAAEVKRLKAAAAVRPE